MLHNLERGERARIKEASDILVDPFKKVVAVAMQRVREGSVDTYKRQTVRLLDEKHGVSYLISDVLVEESSGVIKSKGGLHLGLFIETFRKTRNNEDLFIRVSSIQLPRDIGEVNKDALYPQRGSLPERVRMLAAALSSATKI